MSILNESLAHKIGEIKSSGTPADQAGTARREGHSYVVGDKSAELRHITIPQMFSETVSRYGPRDALVLPKLGKTLSYYDLDREVDTLASGLLALGLEKGDRLGIWAPNRFEWLLTQFATARIGVILVSINPAYRLAELKYALNKVGCNALILAEEFKTSKYLQMLRNLAPVLDTCPKGCLNSAELPHLKIAVAMTDSPGNGVYSFTVVQTLGGPAQQLRLDAITSSLNPDDPIEKRTSTVGRIHPNLEVKIIDTNGNIVAVGAQGELCTRGYSVMHGYWDEPEKTAESIDPNGWMHTGDLAVLDDEGYCSIVGRLKDMIIRGGENIYPSEVEAFLSLHPGVKEVQVFGIPHDKLGEEVCAWFVPADGTTLTAQDIEQHCTGKIAHYKIPKHIRFVDDFPMTVTGKVQKFIMRNWMVENG